MPKLKWMTRDKSQYRAKKLKTSGISLWLCQPELDGWWIPKQHSKNNGYVDVSVAEAHTLLGRHITQGEIVKLDPRIEAEDFDDERLVRCPTEARAHAVMDERLRAGRGV